MDKEKFSVGDLIESEFGNEFFSLVINPIFFSFILIEIMLPEGVGG